MPDIIGRIGTPLDVLRVDWRCEDSALSEDSAGSVQNAARTIDTGNFRASSDVRWGNGHLRGVKLHHRLSISTSQFVQRSSVEMHLVANMIQSVGVDPAGPGNGSSDVEQGHVDLKSVGVVWIANEEVAELAGEFTVGERTYPILEWSSKTYQSRIVPMPPDTADVLRRMQARSGGSAYVFLSLKRLAQIGKYRAGEKHNASYKFVNILGQAWDAIQDDPAALPSEGQSEPYTWEPRSLKVLRKPYGTVMAHHVPTHELKALMGDANLSTNQRFYLAIGDDMAHRVRSAFKFAASA